MTEEALPPELIREILSRVDPNSLVRFRTVSKRWNALLNDKKFINNHKNTFRFILVTKSKIYSVSINPKLEVHELTLDIPDLESKTYLNLIECNGFLLVEMDKGTVVWNPWLRQARWIEYEVNLASLQVSGVGYDDGNMRLEGFGYKALVSYRTESDPNKTLWKTHDFDSNAWNHEVKTCGVSSSNNNTQLGVIVTIPITSVSLDGTLYWVASYKTNTSFFIAHFDFSIEKFYKYCDVPCFDNHHHQDSIVLRVFMEDRFSLLKQCHLTKKIEIWVTKNKIHKRKGRFVEWMNIMEVNIPNLPDLGHNGSYVKLSYFIDDKRLVMCSCDETGRAWIYVLGNNKLISKVKIDLVVDPWPLICTHFPSLVSVPRGQRKEEEELQV